MVDYESAKYQHPTFVLDENGNPTSEVASRLTRYLFENHNQSHSLETLSKISAIDVIGTRKLCRQLLLVDIIQRDFKSGECYKYNLDSTHVELQANLEKSFIF